MEYVKDVASLEEIYGAPGSASINKVAHHLTPLYWDWISASRFCVISTVGPNGTDGSPRGDDSPVVRMQDVTTLLMPDWRGNNRMDTLRNIVADGRISLMFFVPGNNTVIRVNGTAKITVDDDVRQSFDMRGKHPRSVIVISVGEVYTQCARALLRSELWTAKGPRGLPTAGEILAEQTSGQEGGKPYDDAWGARAAKTMW